MSRDLARMVEAAVLLVIAAALVRCCRFARWRGLLGAGPAGSGLDRRQQEAAVAAVRVAVARAERRVLGGALVCLPRAMAVQWMLRRRRIPATLVIGTAPAAADVQRRDFHAWVECDGQVVIGDSGPRFFAPILVLAPR